MRWVKAAAGLNLRHVVYYAKNEDKKAILKSKGKERFANKVQLIVKGLNKEGKTEYWAIFPEGVALHID